ncbi:unnamed protein product [Clavelina lepadiformis]|uniref:Uncharacterized protein n=1 Tax=Clavelina lepadiformis TaxID=159417 RepID=A0ABP0GSZ8_CLALP
MKKLKHLLVVMLLLPAGLTMANKIEETSLGDNSLISYNIPPVTWLNSPTVTKISEYQFDIFGREIHFSVVNQQLHEVTKGQFPVKQTTETESHYEVTLRGDCVYLDDDVTLQGLKKLRVHARKFVSNGQTLTLQAPQVCHQFDFLGRCSFLGKAGESSNGADGKPGIASPLVEINVQRVEGNIEIISEGSDGNRGEDGGDGRDGEDGEEGRSLDTKGYPCRRQKKPSSAWSLRRCDDKIGDPGSHGGNGENGRRAGHSGSGGDSKKITLNTKYIFGSFKVTQRSGNGGLPAIHGHGGRESYGGEGGCGLECYHVCGGAGRVWRCACNTRGQDCSDENRGERGNSGEEGIDGAILYPPPNKGHDGIVEKSSLRKVESLKQWFVDDKDLLQLIHRRGELLFQKNKTDKALETFSFLTSVTNQGSSFHQQVLLRKSALEQGFDFYGNSDKYAPNLGWKYLRRRVTRSITSGKIYETSYNSVKNKIDNAKLAAETLRDAANINIARSKRKLRYERSDLRSERTVYLKSLRQLDKTMKKEQQEIKRLLPKVIQEHNQEERQRQGTIILDFFSALLGFPSAYFGLNPQLAFDSARKIFQIFESNPGCSVPTLNEAKATLQMRLDFAFHYENNKRVKLSQMNTSAAVPIIMSSNLAKSRGKLLQEFSCLLDKEGRSNSFKSLTRLLDDFFRDGDFRISLINKLINFDLQIKQVSYEIVLLREWKNAVNTIVQLSTNNIPMTIKQTFTDLLYSVYQQNEATIIRSLYELAKGYQFMSLWKFDALKNYVNAYGDQSLTSNLGSLNGMFHFEQIMQTLEDDRNRFLNLISTTAGAGSHTYTVLREMDQVTHPGVFDLLHNKGRFTVHLNLDPNITLTTGCSSCYNARLISIYVEITGSAQPIGVPSRIYVKVAHMGDSYFLLPLSNGEDTVVHFQQKPENIDGGHVIFFNRKKLVTSVTDLSLGEKFQQSEGNRFCHEYNRAQDFFGGQLCKSPYASYTITVPRDRTLSCGSHISGMNCQELDFTRFEKIRIFMKARAWSSYVTPPNLQAAN